MKKFFLGFSAGVLYAPILYTVDKKLQGEFQKIALVMGFAIVLLWLFVGWVFNLNLKDTLRDATGYKAAVGFLLGFTVFYCFLAHT